MKLKRLAEDFQVVEEVSLRADGGRFGLYRLTKQSLGTPEAIDAILRRWKLARSQVAFAGLKDRHALTAQFITIQGGPRRNWSEANLAVEYLGQASRPIHASDIVANRFVVVIRDLAGDETERARGRMAQAADDGLPNYFDNQRFGSLGESGEFIARPWCLGNYERALWLALAEANVHDSPGEREEKEHLRQHWGDWAACQASVTRQDRRGIFLSLVDRPRDFRRAIAGVRQDLRSLWLAAFQSHLWNQLLAAAIQQVCRPEQLTLHSLGRRDVPFYAVLEAGQRVELTRLRLPFPSARLHLAGSPFQLLYDRALAAEGIALREIRVKYPRDSFFSKGERCAVFQPADVRQEAAADDLYAGRHKLTLRFALPRGSYATILIKQVTSGGELTEEKQGPFED